MKRQFFSIITDRFYFPRMPNAGALESAHIPNPFSPWMYAFSNSREPALLPKETKVGKSILKNRPFDIWGALSDLILGNSLLGCELYKL